MPGGGSCVLRRVTLSGGLKLFFEDSGPRIPEDQRNNIFEFFSAP
jgi:hypothetical protein